MFFNKVIDELGSMPPVLIKNILATTSSVILTADDRYYLGNDTIGVKFADMPKGLKNSIKDFINYINRQQYKSLQNTKDVESGVCSIKPKSPSSFGFPNRYINSIAHQLVIPIRGEVTVNNTECRFKYILELGKIYRINNRTHTEFIATEDFLAVVLMFMDKDELETIDSALLLTYRGRQLHERFKKINNDNDLP